MPRQLTSAEAAMFNTPSFKDASLDLAASCGIDHELTIFRDFDSYLKTVKAGDPLPLESLATAAQVAFAITLLHVTMGTSIYMTQALMDEWVAAGNADCVECRMCGYRMPQQYSACVLCNGVTGEGGAWARRQGRTAGMN